MPDSAFSQSLLLALVAACLGGFVAKKLKSQPLIGYILGGVVLGLFVPSATAVSKLAELGVILLLFSIGLELSFSKLNRVLKPALVGAFFQLVSVSCLGYFFFKWLGFGNIPSLIFSLGISLSSTAVVIKTLSERGELGTVHGGIMTGWLLIQDLAVVPMVILINSLATPAGSLLGETVQSLLKASYVIVVTVLLGRHVFPYLIHKIASINSREILVLSALALALGTAYLTYLLGISPSLGAFLAGLVIAESAENHAVFAEIRPLRDLFVAIFFVTLGLMVKPAIFLTNFWTILGIFVFILMVKSLVNFITVSFLGYHGKTAVAVGLGLAQVGEFSFVIFSLAVGLGLVSTGSASIVIASVLLTLLMTPVLFKSAVPLWRKLKEKTVKVSWLNNLFLGKEKKLEKKEELSDHIIICGYGRVGGWVGKALGQLGTPFVIIDYNQKVVGDLKKKGLPVVYGDPAEAEVLEAAGIKRAKALVLAIPDRVSQEILIAHVQSVAPLVKIISRVHLDEDWERLKLLRVDKVVQPEFEASLAITRAILSSMGKSKEEIGQRIKKLRISRSLK